MKREIPCEAPYDEAALGGEPGSSTVRCLYRMLATWSIECIYKTLNKYGFRTR